MARAATKPAANPQAIEGEIVHAEEVLHEAAARSLVSSPDGLDASLAIALVDAEIDKQIATAHKYPRSPARAVQAITELATMDFDTARECVYSVPRDGKFINGPSVRLAELVGNQWGNNRMDARVVAVNTKEKYIEAEGVYHDLETNSAVRVKVRRRISNKSGSLFSADMIQITGNAAVSIALRNAIFRGVPRPIWNKAYNAVTKVVFGDERTLGERRLNLLRSFKEDLGVEPRKVYAILGVTGELDITMELLFVAHGIYTGLKNNEVTLDDLLNTAPKADNSTPKTLQNAFGEEDAKPKAAAPEPEKIDAETGEVTTVAETPQDQASTDDALGDMLSTPAAVVKEEPKPEPAKEDKAPPKIVDAHTGEPVQKKLDVAHVAIVETPPDVNAKITDTVSAKAPSGAHAGPGEVYTLITDTEDGHGLKPGYRDGKKVTHVGRNVPNIAAYDDHPPAAVEAEPEPSIRSDPENRVEPTTGEGDSVYKDAPEVRAFYDALAQADSWQDIRSAFVIYRQTETYKASPDVEKVQAQRDALDAYDTCVKRGGEAITPEKDSLLFVLWVDHGAIKGEAMSMFTKFMRTPAYSAFTEEQKAAIAAKVKEADAR